jgi:hypothetical protein
MRIRWVALIFIAGVAIAAWHRSSVEAEVVLFGCLLLYCLRKFDQRLADISQSVTAAQCDGIKLDYILAEVRKLSAHKSRSNIYKGDLLQPHPADMSVRGPFITTLSDADAANQNGDL